MITDVFFYLDMWKEKKEAMVGKYRVLHMKEFYSTTSSPNIVGVIKLSSMSRAAHGTC
jgi:hypothetical protein